MTAQGPSSDAFDMHALPRQGRRWRTPARRALRIRWLNVLRRSALPFLLGVGMAAADTPAAALHDSIAPQPLASALAAFAAQTGLQLVYVSEVVADRRSRGAGAGTSPTEALGRLLEGTGLRFEFLNSRTVRIAAERPDRVDPEPAAATATAPMRHGDPRLTTISEVLVTANRREETLTRVPMSIVAWTQDELEATGVKSMAELAARTPGVEYDFYPDLGPGTHTNIAIRGVNARDGSATGIYLDDIPIRPDPGGSFGRTMPLPVDLDRVEILRGPQGTLLGEGAEGGAIRFVMPVPSLSAASGYAHTEIATTARGGASFQAVAAASEPLVAGRVAARLSGGYQAVGGFIDRVDPFTAALVEANVNRTIAKSARLALVFAPTESLSISPSLTYQSRHVHDSPSFYDALSKPDAGILHSGKLLQQPVDDEFSLAVVKLTAALRAAELTAVVSHFHRSAWQQVDNTNNPIGWGNPLGPEYPLSDSTYLRSTGALVQSAWTGELRLTSTERDGRFSWIAGAQLLHAGYTDAQHNGPAVNSIGQLLAYDNIADGREHQFAAYGEASWKFGDHTAASLGLRATHSSYDATFDITDHPGGTVYGSGHESPVAPRVRLSYEADADNLYYASVATGFRLGGLNPPIQPWCTIPIPVAYQPDTVISYEIGAKNRLLDGRLQLESSLFHMHWRNLQIDQPVATCFTYTTNAGSAASDGFDLAARAVVATGFELGLAVGYTNARFTETILDGSSIRARDGDAMGSIPVVPSPWNITTFAEYSVRAGSRASAAFAGDAIFHSRNPGPFYSQEPASLSYDPGKRPDPSTLVVNLRATVRWPSIDLRLFVDNVLDTQPVVLRRNVYTGSTLFLATTFRPRTLGLALDWRY